MKRREDASHWWYLGTDGPAQPKSWWSSLDCNCRLPTEQKNSEQERESNFNPHADLEILTDARIHEYDHFYRILNSQIQEALKCRTRLCIALVCCQDRPFRADDEPKLFHTMSRLRKIALLCSREVDFPALISPNTIGIIFVETEFTRAFNITQRILSGARLAENACNNSPVGIKFSAAVASFPHHGLCGDLLFSSCENFLAEAKLRQEETVVPVPGKLNDTKEIENYYAPKIKSLNNSFGFWGDLVTRQQESVTPPPPKRLGAEKWTTYEK